MKTRRLALGGFVAGIVGVAMAAAAWACVPVATLNLSTTQVSPGQDIGITGAAYNGNKPAVVHFNSIDGPVLGSFVPNGGRIEGNVTIPPGTPPGDYLLVVTQEFTQGVQTWGVPARAAISVVGPNGAPTLGASRGSTVEGRPAGLEASSSPGAGALLLAGVGAAGVVLFLAGLAAMMAGRRTRSATAASVRS
jgi:hypothetical protein